MCATTDVPVNIKNPNELKNEGEKKTTAPPPRLCRCATCQREPTPAAPSAARRRPPYPGDGEGLLEVAAAHQAEAPGPGAREHDAVRPHVHAAPRGWLRQPRRSHRPGRARPAPGPPRPPAPPSPGAAAAAPAAPPRSRGTAAPLTRSLLPGRTSLPAGSRTQECPGAASPKQILSSLEQC